MSDRLDTMQERLTLIPDPPQPMWDRWARIIREDAPDLADMLLGDRA